MTDFPKTGNFDKFARLTQVATGLSIIVGIIVGLSQIYKTSAELKDAAQSAKMNALPSVRELVKDDIQIHQQMSDFLQNYDKPKLDALLGQQNVEIVYYSPALKNVRDVGHHYEEMGALVKSHYVDFDLIYDMVPFPDEFWDTTEPLRTKALTNWSNHKGLPDFWSNFSYLQCRFETRREKKPEPSDVCRGNQ